MSSSSQSSAMSSPHSRTNSSFVSSPQKGGRSPFRRVFNGAKTLFNKADETTGKEVKKKRSSSGSSFLSIVRRKSYSSIKEGVEVASDIRGENDGISKQDKSLGKNNQTLLRSPTKSVLKNGWNRNNNSKHLAEVLKENQTASPVDFNVEDGNESPVDLEAEKPAAPQTPRSPRKVTVVRPRYACIQQRPENMRIDCFVLV